MSEAFRTSKPGWKSGSFFFYVRKIMCYIKLEAGGRLMGEPVFGGGHRLIGMFENMQKPQGRMQNHMCGRYGHTQRYREYS